MKESEQKILSDLRPEFVRSLEPNDITPLLSNITEDNYELITNLPTKPKRVMKFLEIAKTKIPYLQELIDALKEAGYVELAIKLVEKLEDHKKVFDEAVQYLKETYTNECEVIKEHWSKLMDYRQEFELDKMYIDLEIIKESSSSNEKIKTYQDVFGVRNGERTYRKIVLEGDPGTGKTTYVHRLVQHWTRGDTEDGKWLNKQFDLVIVLRLGDIRPGQTLRDAMSHIPPSCRIPLLEYVEDCQNHRRILIVLDAFDEMPENCNYFNRLIEEQLLGDAPVPNITFLISTRISHSCKKELKKKHFLIRTIGFSPEVVREHFSAKIDNLEHALTQQNDQMGLYRSPLFVGMAASLGYIPGELFDLMETFCSKTVERYLYRSTESSQEKKPVLPLCKKIKKFLGKMAFLRLKHKVPIEPDDTKQLVINLLEDELDDKPELIQLCCNVGLLWPKKGISQIDIPWSDSMTTPEKYSFPHQLFVEYFAADFVAAFSLFRKFPQKLIFIPTDPFSYFLTGLAPEFKQQLLKASVQKENEIVTFKAPWICHPDDLPVEFDLWNTVDLGDTVDQICCSDSPNQNQLIKVITEKDWRFFSNVTRFRNFTFDSDGVLILDCIRSRKLQFSLVHDCTLLDSGTEAFQNWINQQELKSISLIGFEQYSNNLTEAVLKSLPSQSDLEVLEINKCREDGLMALLQNMLYASACLPLKRFLLHDCLINEGSNLIFSALPQCIKVLELSNCNLCQEAANNLTKYLKTSDLSLQKVDFSGTKAVGLYENTEIFHFLPSTLVSLDVEGCNLSKNSVAALIKYLRKTTSLLELDVSQNELVGSMPEFAEALVNSSLKSVNLLACNLTEGFVEMFLDGVKNRNEVFECIKISWKEVREEETCKMLKSLLFMK